MDAEARIKVIEQLPVIMRLAEKATTAFTRSHMATLEANGKSQDRVHRAWEEIRATAAAQLERDDLGPDERKALLDVLVMTGDRQAEADARNQTVLERWTARHTFGVLAAVVILTTIGAGGKVVLQNASVIRR